MARAGLTTEIVVAEAGRVADEVGLERMTLAAVAARLGVRLPSLYKHVAGLDALRVLLAASAGRELAAVLSAATVGRSGDDALLALAGAYRDFAQRRPGAYAATLRAPSSDDPEHAAAGAAVLEVVLAVLAGFGLEGDDATDAIRGLRALLHGFTAIEAAGGFRLPRPLDRSVERVVLAYGAALRAWAASSSGPGEGGAAAGPDGG